MATSEHTSGIDCEIPATSGTDVLPSFQLHVGPVNHPSYAYKQELAVSYPLTCGNPYDFTIHPKDHTFSRVLELAGFTTVDEFEMKHRGLLGQDPTPEKMTMVLRMIRVGLQTEKERLARLERRRAAEDKRFDEPEMGMTDRESISRLTSAIAYASRADIFRALVPSRPRRVRSKRYHVTFKRANVLICG
jgi:hypothetical protein